MRIFFSVFRISIPQTLNHLRCFTRTFINPGILKRNSPPMEPEQQQSQETSKKAAKKEAAKAEKLRRRQEAATGVSGVSIDGPDPLAANYGDIPIKDLQSKEVSGRKWTTVSSLTEQLKDETVLIRGRAQPIRAVGKKMAFFTVRLQIPVDKTFEITHNSTNGIAHFCQMTIEKLFLSDILFSNILFY